MVGLFLWSVARVECGAGASPARLESESELGTYPQPPIILMPLNQSRLHRILPNILAFILETLMRPQHMIERLFFPDRT